MRYLTVGELLKEQRSRLRLELVAGDQALNRKITTSQVNRPGLTLAWHSEHFRAERIQIIGRGEQSFCIKAPQKKLKTNLERMLTNRKVPCLVITRNLRAPAALAEACHRHKVPLLRTKLKTGTFVEEMAAWLEDRLAPRTRIHGGLVDIYGLGVLITGEAGIGKSECALELVKRGHIFVSDDMVEIKHKPGDILLGRCPEALRHHMEVRGLGIIDVKLLFGIGSVLETSEVGLVVQLEMWNPQSRYERVGLETKTTHILDVEVPEVLIPVRPGRNIASLIEVAALSQQLRAQGYATAERFNDNLIERMAPKGRPQA